MKLESCAVSRNVSLKLIATEKTSHLQRKEGSGVPDLSFSNLIRSGRTYLVLEVHDSRCHRAETVRHDTDNNSRHRHFRTACPPRPSR